MTKTWKCLIASFLEDVNKRRRISFSLSKLDCGPQEINSREIRLHLPFSPNCNKHDKDWKNGNSFKTTVFTAVAIVDAKAPLYQTSVPQISAPSPSSAISLIVGNQGKSVSVANLLITLCVNHMMGLRYA